MDAPEAPPEVVTGTVEPDAPATTTELTATHDAPPPAAHHQTHAVSVSFTDQQKQIVRDTVCKPRDRDATDAELGLFLARCQRTGLDPLAGQIHAVFRKDNQNGGRERMTIQVGIDGFRLVAQRTGDFAGATREWCGQDGVWRDVWLDTNPPAAARVTVRRIVQGHVVTQDGIATWAEYGDTRNVWKGKPAHMLAKCAEALALRSMFPAELSGLYTGDEMRGADADADTTSTPAPTAAPPVPPWAFKADKTQLRDATVRALAAAVVPEEAHGDYGKALLQAVKASTGGPIPAVVVSVLHALADVAKAYDEAGALDAGAADAADRDDDGEPVDGELVPDPLPGIEPPAAPGAPSDPYDLGA